MSIREYINKKLAKTRMAEETVYITVTSAILLFQARLFASRECLSFILPYNEQSSARGPDQPIRSLPAVAQHLEGLILQHPQEFHLT